MRLGLARSFDELGRVERRAGDEEAEPVREGGSRARADALPFSRWRTYWDWL